MLHKKITAYNFKMSSLNQLYLLFIKASPETTTKATWLTSSLKPAIVSCILWGTNRVWCTDFKRHCRHCYVDHVRQTDSKEPTWDIVSRERNHALLCSYKRPLNENMGFLLDTQHQAHVLTAFWMGTDVIVCRYLQATISRCCVVIIMCPHIKHSLLYMKHFVPVRYLKQYCWMNRLTLFLKKSAQCEINLQWCQHC